VPSPRRVLVDVHLKVMPPRSYNGDDLGLEFDEKGLASGSGFEIGRRPSAFGLEFVRLLEG
jgi:hypothetical protein